MTTVTLRSNESEEQLFKRFRAKVAQSGVLREVRLKRWFVPKSESRRLAKQKAARMHHRRQRKQEETN
ncbi:MAG: 30S ribosomal protein S21 [Anaerolineales bacterium]|nr:30S ribosomal protein S21 [Anaerolineales bacterium]